MGNVPIQTIVRDNKTGSEGVVVDDVWNITKDNEVLVVYWGVLNTSIILLEDVTIVGRYDVEPDPLRCGHNGDSPCRFLSQGPTGFTCSRFSSMRQTMMMVEHSTKMRSPTLPYPTCQEEGV